ncbi:amidohydrolase family protein [Myxococcaceae bacterium JPH2]|nr:amidohydrolase family protein [Myxococcaceae bacterium JPH2]
MDCRPAVLSCLLLALALPPAACAGNPLPPSASATLYVNGRVWLGEGQPDGQAFMVSQGRIIAVGATHQLEARPHVAVVDLKGRRVIPALVDAHSHPESFANPDWIANDTKWVERGEYGPTAEEVRALVAAKAAERPAGTPVVVFVGINFYKTCPKDVRAFLDDVAPAHLVLAADWGGHGLAVNSRLLAAAGYADGAPDSETGRLSRDPSGRLTGFIQEMMELPVFQALTAYLPDSFLTDGLVQYGQAWAAFGGGVVYDINFAVSGARIEGIRAAVASRTRVPFIPVDIITASGPRPGPHNGRRVWKLFLDGAPGDCTAARLPQPPLAYSEPSTCPYTFNAPWYGSTDVSKAFAVSVLRDARAMGAHVLFHALGDGGVELLLQSLAEVGGGSWAGAITMEHGDLVTRSQLSRLAAYGVPVIQNATHLASVPGLTTARLQAPSVADTELLQSMRDAGVSLAFGTDAFGYPTSPWLEMQIATTHPFNQREAISREAFLAGYTTIASSARGQAPDSQGRIAVGQRASFAILDRDVINPRAVPPEDLPKTVSVLTVLDGEVAWSDGTLAPRSP